MRRITLWCLAYLWTAAAALAISYFANWQYDGDAGWWLVTAYSFPALALATRGVQAAHVKKLRNILGLLDVAAGPDDLNVPSFRLHPLKGDLKGHWSIWVNGNWRVTFRFVGADTELVDYQDYH